MKEDKKGQWNSYMRDNLSARKAEGRCVSCGGQSVPGKTRCTECAERQRKYTQARNRTRRAAGLCITCNAAADQGSSYCGACRKKHNEQSTARQRRLREKVLDAYGRVCACCEEDESVFLSIDHVNNDGAEHRRQTGTSGLYAWLVKNDFPPGFQTLCRNCNWAKHVLGSCPHEITA